MRVYSINVLFAIAGINKVEDEIRYPYFLDTSNP
jgi:hypothetical protein